MDEEEAEEAAEEEVAGNWTFAEEGSCPMLTAPSAIAIVPEEGSLTLKKKKIKINILSLNIFANFVY